MLLAFDIGNSAIKGAIFDGPQPLHTFRLAHPLGSASDVATALAHELTCFEIRRAALCSVVPDVERSLREALGDLLSDAPFTVAYDRRLPVRLGYEDPSRLGADRIALAAGAHWVGRSLVHPSATPIIAVDAGTAVTFNVIDAGDVFRGGLIWAGPDLVRQALHAGTAQLPIADEPIAITPIATDTRAAIASASMLGFVEGTRGILRRLTHALDTRPMVVVTGGRAVVLVEALDVIDRWEPHLVLHGVRVVAEMNEAGSSRA